MTSSPVSLHRPHTVTFDCWSTLLHEAQPSQGSDRAKVVAAATGSDVEAVAAAFRDAWRRHQIEWHRRRVFDGRDMTRSALDALGVRLEPAGFERLLATLEDEIEARDIRAIDGAGEVLERLASLGVRRALICDTGFTPGRVVRRLLDRAGLSCFLEATIFSEEIGVPKPDPRAFGAALSALGVAPEGAVHVGDLRRSDVAGARAANMGVVRFAGHHDDAEHGSGRAAGVIDCVSAGCSPACPRPEADAVIHRYSEMLPLFAYR